MKMEHGIVKFIFKKCVFEFYKVYKELSLKRFDNFSI